MVYNIQHLLQAQERQATPPDVLVEIGLCRIYPESRPSNHVIEHVSGLPTKTERLHASYRTLLRANAEREILHVSEFILRVT